MADAIDIDNISEDDLLDALGSLGVETTPSSNLPETIDDIEDIQQIDNTPSTIEDDSLTHTEQTISIDSSNIDNIANLFKELLNNKSIEITIKLKDN